MKLRRETTVHELIERYPFLLDWLAAYSPEFEKLKNPMLRRTVARVATIETAAAMADVPVDTLLDDVREAVARQSIADEEARATTGSPGVAEKPSAEERARRQDTLKEIIGRLHDGATVDDVKAHFDELVSEVDAAEIAQMEQALIAEGMPVEEVQRLCDVHVTVFKDALEHEEPEAVEAGHPVDAYRRENEAAAEIVESVRLALRGLDTEDDEERQAALAVLEAELDRLADIDVHYARKENQLFPVLERHGVEGPTKVMWGIDDDIRKRLKHTRSLARAADASALAADLPETLEMIDDMIYKEERILLPAALDVLSDDEWAHMAEGDADIGFAWISPPERELAAVEAAFAEPADGALLSLTTGSLALEQLELVFGAMPFDITFVDENDRVLFYSEGERVFPRSPAAIGREVRNCHPPQSVAKVEQILTEFRAGTKELAEFWIEFHGRFTHIRYFALRDDAGTYQGCLEVVQDATHVRSLVGERRLVDW